MTTQIKDKRLKIVDEGEIAAFLSLNMISGCRYAKIPYLGVIISPVAFIDLIALYMLEYLLSRRGYN